MAIDYVSVDETPLLVSASGEKSGVYLLWGDRVRTQETKGGWVRVKARGREGWVSKDALGGESLLELYFIDVGQGDGVLIRTPDHRHVLIDGGFGRNRQPSGKNAADFVDWKFVKDYGTSVIALDAMIASHNDADHFGGLWDLLDDNEGALEELDATAVTVGAFYHAGLSWWKRPKGNARTLGPHVSTSEGSMWTRLLEDRASAETATSPGAGHKLAGEWAKLFQRLLATRTSSGGKTPIRRLSHLDRYLPGFGPDDGEAAVRVLAPVEFSVDGEPALRRFAGGDSINTNGQSILLRVDYGRSRVILTGDLNAASQRALLEDYTGQVQELECDVAKACHHGSDDVSYRFLQALRPAVTIISSGDNEGHDHPRPGIVAASATTGYLSIEEDRIATPLIYSTELARSHRFSKAARLEVNPEAEDALEIKGAGLAKAKATFPKRAGQKEAGYRTLDRALFLSGLIYGLVNVRTNGERILCATMSESDQSWQIKVLQSRF